MKKQSISVAVGLWCLMAAAVMGCGSDGEDEATGGGGTAGSGATGTGGPGGSSGGGGATVSGAAGTGGSGGGGSGADGGGTTGSGATGTGGSGGSAGGGSSLADRLFVTCTNWQSNGFVLGCLGVFGDTYVADCTAEWTGLAEGCAAEVEAVLDCASMLPVLDYECDADDEVTFAPGVCESETAALEQCTQ